MPPVPAYTDDPHEAGEYQSLEGYGDMKELHPLGDRRTKAALLLSLLLVGGVFVYRLAAPWLLVFPGPPVRGAGRFTFDAHIETPNNLLDSDDPANWIDWHKYGHDGETDKWSDWKKPPPAAHGKAAKPLPETEWRPGPAPPEPAMVASAEAIEAGAADDDRYLLAAGWDRGAAPTVRTFDWTIREGRIAGVADSGPVLLINDEYPGPLIECNAGDTLRIRVRNDAAGPNAAVALHWRGLRLRGGQNGLDGVAGVTQCAQKPDGGAAVVTYEVRVGVEDAGTHYYHATTGPAHLRGLVGPLVVHGRGNGTGAVPRVDGIDRVIVLSDYYGADVAARRAAYLGPVPRYAEPVPDGALLNGHADGLWSVHLHEGRVHRLRLVNAAMFASFEFEIDRHALEVLEMDGAEVDDPHPFNSRSITIAPGQRISVAAKLQSLDFNVDPDLGRSTVWLRARIQTDPFKADHAHLQTEIRAVVPTAMSGGDPIPLTRSCAHYGGAACVRANASELLPHHATDSAGGGEETPMPAAAEFEVPLLAHFITLAATAGAGPGLHVHRGYLNDSSGTYAALAAPPTVLETLARLGREGSLAGAVGTLDAATATAGSLLVYYTRAPGRVVDLVLTNHDRDAHPFYLHGHKFWVAAAGADPYAPGSGAVFARPLRRDTVLVPAGAWVRLRLLLDNPGVWPFHCTVEWHKEAGLTMLFAVGVDELARVLEKTHLSTC